MRLWRPATIGAVALLGACREEPDFDERYATAEKSIREKAAELDAELKQGERDRLAAEAARREAAGDSSEEPRDAPQR